MLYPLLIFILSYTMAAMADDDILFTKDYRDTAASTKHFSEKEYQNAIQQYKNGFRKPKKQKAKNKTTPTSSYGSESYKSESAELKSIINHKCNVMIPVNATSSDGNEISPGYYDMSVKTKSDGSKIFVLSQSGKVIASTPAKDGSDYESETINYCTAVGYDTYIKLVYGNIDLSLQGFLNVVGH